MRGGSSELAAAAASSVRRHKAALLAYHGAVVAGPTLHDVVCLAKAVEHVAQVALLVQPRGLATAGAGQGVKPVRRRA